MYWREQDKEEGLLLKKQYFQYFLEVPKTIEDTLFTFLKCNIAS